jgi:hypothetical protein
MMTELYIRLSILFLALAMNADGRYASETEQAGAYIRVLFKPPTGEIEEVAS